MNDLLKDDGFAQFIFTQYFKNKSLNTKEELMKFCLLPKEMSTVLECFKPGVSAINKY